MKGVVMRLSGQGARLSVGCCPSPSPTPFALLFKVTGPSQPGHCFSGVPCRGPILCGHCKGVPSLGACAQLLQLQQVCSI